MDVIFGATDDERRHPVLPGDAAQEWPKPLLQRRGHEFAPFFGAENAMETGTNIRHVVYSTVPAGLRQLRIGTRR